MKFIFTNRVLKDKIIIDDLCLVMKSFGVKEELPRSKKHLNYDTLDLKSKRILNRLFKYLTENKIDISDFFRDIIVEQVVKTKTKTEKVELIKAEKVFLKMQDVGIV